MDDMLLWVSGWPQKPGWYWTTYKLTSGNVRTIPVEVRLSGSGEQKFLSFIAGGMFLFPTSDTVRLWHTMDPPPVSPLETKQEEG